MTVVYSDGSNSGLLTPSGRAKAKSGSNKLLESSKEAIAFLKCVEEEEEVEESCMERRAKRK